VFQVGQLENRPANFQQIKGCVANAAKAYTDRGMLNQAFSAPAFIANAASAVLASHAGIRCLVTLRLTGGRLDA
jgi:hypothetical protein